MGDDGDWDVLCDVLHDDNDVHEDDQYVVQEKAVEVKKIEIVKPKVEKPDTTFIDPR